MTGDPDPSRSRPGARRDARGTGWLLAYGAAMGLLEAAVVVYLRELYYPEGFRFPIVPMPVRTAAVEIAREAATLVMLLAVAALARRDALGRFFVFAFLFGVWDLTYYLGLRIFLGWPESLATWDLLFLIPVPWLSPVGYPVLVSLLLIAGYSIHEALSARGSGLRVSRLGWAVATVGALTIVVSFCFRFRDVLEQRMPGSFPVGTFSIGLTAALAPFALATWRGLPRRRAHSRTPAPPR